MRQITLDVYEADDPIPPMDATYWGRVAIIRDARILLARPLLPAQRPDLYSEQEKVRRVFWFLSEHPDATADDITAHRESVVWEAADRTLHAGVQRWVLSSEQIGVVTWDDAPEDRV